MDREETRDELVDLGAASVETLGPTGSVIEAGGLQRQAGLSDED